MSKVTTITIHLTNQPRWLAPTQHQPNRVGAYRLVAPACWVVPREHKPGGPNAAQPDYAGPSAWSPPVVEQERAERRDDKTPTRMVAS